MSPAACCKSDFLSPLFVSVSQARCPPWSVQSGWFLLIESRRRISKTSVHTLNHLQLEPLSLLSHIASIIYLFTYFFPPPPLSGALCAAMCAVTRHRSNPTCGSTPETRTTTTSRLTKPLTRQSPRAAGKHTNCSSFSLLSSFISVFVNVNSKSTGSDLHVLGLYRL